MLLLEGGAVVLTYVVCADVVEAATGVTPRLLEDAAPATGTALDPPVAIDHRHIVGHALRHLAWLSDHDPAAAHVLGSWRSYLSEHRPAPSAQQRDPGEPGPASTQNLGVSR